MRKEIIILIIGMSIVSLLPRMLPIGSLSRFEFPERFKNWLSYIPAAVLASLLAMSVLAPDKAVDISPQNHYLLAFVPTFIVAILTRNLFYTLAIGISCMAAINHFMG